MRNTSRALSKIAPYSGLVFLLVFVGKAALAQDREWKDHYLDGKAAFEERNFARAEQSFRTALRIAEKAKAEDARAAIMENLVSALLRTGYLVAAEEFARELVKLQETRFGKEDLRTLRAISSLVDVLGSQASAAQQMGDGIFASQGWGGGYIGSTNAYFQLQSAARPKFGEARNLSLRLAKGYETAVGRNSMEVAKSLRGAGVACAGLRKFRDAEGLLDESLNLLQNMNQLDQEVQVQVHIVYTDQGNMYLRWGKNQEAISILEKAREFWEKEDTGTRGRLGYALYLLQDAFEKEKRYEEAAATNARLLEVEEQALGTEHVALIPTLERLAKTLRRLKRMEEAEKLEGRAKLLRKPYPDVRFVK